MKTYAVPAFPKSPLRAKERAAKRAKKLLPRNVQNPQHRFNDAHPLGQTGHTPNHRHRGKDVEHRNSIWPASRERLTPVADPS